MKKYYLSFLLFYSTFSSKNSCNKDDNLIEWSENRKLNWGDFKGEFSKLEKSAAEVSIKLKLYYVFNGTLNYDVVCYMVKNESWTGEESDYALNHEQGHFNIGEIYARKLRKAVAEKSRYISYSNIKKLDSLELKYYLLLKAEEQNYDNETTIPARNREGQKIWDNRIMNSLDSFKNYTRDPNAKLKWKRYLK